MTKSRGKHIHLFHLLRQRFEDKQTFYIQHLHTLKEKCRGAFFLLFNNASSPHPISIRKRARTWELKRIQVEFLGKIIWENTSRNKVCSHQHEHKLKLLGSFAANSPETEFPHVSDAYSHSGNWNQEANIATPSHVPYLQCIWGK